MSNKMKKLMLIFFIGGLVAAVWGFDPRARDFASEYQYRMYKSWSSREATIKDLPARINSQYVKRSLVFDQSGEANVIYLWDNWKIYNQKEDLEAKLPFSNYETELIIAGELLYRLNCRHQIFARHYLDKMPISISYQGQREEFALDSLFTHYQGVRLPGAELHPVINNDILVQLILEFNNGDQLMLSFGDVSSYPTRIRQLMDFENGYDSELLPADFPRHIPETIIYLPPRKPEQKREEKVERSEILEPQEADTIVSEYEQKILDWVSSNQDNSFGSEILNNKIPDMKEFLQEQFKQHSLLIKGDKYNLSHTPFTGNLRSNLYFEIREEDGWIINATHDIKIENDKVRIADFEEYDLSDLEDYDIKVIAPYIPQLLMSHRVMSSDLAGFILQPDIAETTLVIHGSSRNIFEINSYRDLLLLLGRFWGERIIYYNIGDFKLVNGYIEFKGYLAAENPENGEFDLAEIRYRLDDDYTIVLAMVVVFPYQNQENTQGR